MAEYFAVPKDLSTRRFADSLAGVWLAFRRLEDEGELTSHERDVLAHVPAEGSLSLRQLAEHLAIGLSTASVLMKRLERRGLVARRRDPADERRLALTLTVDGRAALDRASDLDIDRLAKALRQLGEVRTHELIEALEQVAAIGRTSRPRIEGEQPHRRSISPSRAPLEIDGSGAADAHRSRAP